MVFCLALLHPQHTGRMSPRDEKTTFILIHVIALKMPIVFIHSPPVAVRG